MLTLLSMNGEYTLFVLVTPVTYTADRSNLIGQRCVQDQVQEME